MDIIFCDFLIFYQSLFSSQMKRSVIISNKYGIYELSHELGKNLRPRTVGNWEISGKFQNFIELYPSAKSSSQNKNIVNASKKLLKNRN